MQQELIPAPTDMREVCGHFATGVVVVTAQGVDGPVGFTCQSFASLSLAPPLISISPSRTSTSWPAIRAAGAFCVNILAAGQEELSNAFAVSGGDKFAGVAWSAGPSGAPVFDGVAAWIDCVLEAEHDGGDHTIAIGRVSSLNAWHERAPLLYHRGRYVQKA